MLRFLLSERTAMKNPIGMENNNNNKRKMMAAHTQSGEFLTGQEMFPVCAEMSVWKGPPAARVSAELATCVVMNDHRFSWEQQR